MFVMIVIEAESWILKWLQHVHVAKPGYRDCLFVFLDSIMDELHLAAQRICLTDVPVEMLLSALFLRPCLL